MPNARGVVVRLTVRVSLPNGFLSAADGEKLRADFERQYKAVYGLTIPSMAIEAVTWSVTVSSAPVPVTKAPAVKSVPAPAPARHAEVFESAAGAFVRVPVYDRFDMPPGSMIKGPAIIAEDETSTIVTATFDATINALGYIVLTRQA